MTQQGISKECFIYVVHVASENEMIDYRNIKTSVLTFYLQFIKMILISLYVVYA